MANYGFIRPRELRHRRGIRAFCVFQVREGVVRLRLLSRRPKGNGGGYRRLGENTGTRLAVPLTAYRAGGHMAAAEWLSTRFVFTPVRSRGDREK